ncbi:Hypothetical protein SCLAV_p0277 (plasmid) [Streptomyces clavuligerus]|uniref:Secreted protein n=1 Tax=Streptomyces clavuligerus TaxID=1901 RepID=D5SIM5_STRCL|nr:Hypothetical protein SCLAV_p0277 [Streptomyces clavuligerus]
MSRPWQGIRRRAGVVAGVCVLAVGGAAPGAAAAADPWNVQCDGQWHFVQVGEPEITRVVADRFLFDNRKGTEPMEYTERVSETFTRSFSNSTNLGISATASFNAWFVSVETMLSAEFGFTAAQENTVEKQTEVRYTANPGTGAIYYIGLNTVTTRGYYERILGCDTPQQRYQSTGLVSESAPGVGKALWAEPLPALETTS